MKKKGFTLVELVIVVVLLAIIASVAIPRLFSLRGDADAAVVQGLKGALIEASQLVHAKASIENLNSGTNTINLNGGTINLRAGYPRVASSCDNFSGQLTYWLAMDIDAAICSGGNDADWYGYVDRNAFHFMPASYSSTSENCYVTYVTASERVNGVWIDTDSATVLMEISGCG